jgi:RimJ/RimL family protein N-acetyltransferase
MELKRYEDDDLALSEALESDPVVMRELGGPIDPARLPVVHARRVGEPWYFTIVPEPGHPAVGTIGIWETEHEGVTLHETGWMVLPAFQARGVASRALSILIERARPASEIPRMHAFPPTSNAPSNALCRKFGFTLLGEHAFVYAGRTLQCNHWTLDVASGVD